MGLMSLLAVNPLGFLVLAFVLLYSVIFHEVAHGWVASLFGDDTARDFGRLTLNPASHIDPLGTLMLFVVGFGWAKPVPVNYHRLRGSRFGVAAVSLAGPATNILIAVLAVFFLQFPGVVANPVLAALLPSVVRVNVMLGAFNLIPIPPLDGSKVILDLLPEETRRGLAWLERFGLFFLMALLFTGLLNPLIALMQNAIYAGISMLFGAFG